MATLILGPILAAKLIGVAAIIAAFGAAAHWLAHR
jgi:hypothetical protein